MMMDGAGEFKSMSGNVAPLRNVVLLNTLIRRVQSRDEDLPGLACFYGPSGYGKTQAAVWNAQHYNCYWVEVKSTWTVKKLMMAIAKSMRLPFSGTAGDMIEMIADELLKSGRPLLIDEADLMLKDSLIGAVRDIYETSQGTIILIGEEKMPQKLQRWERVHNRMLNWVQAQPADLREVGVLAKLKCPGLEIAPDVLQLVLEQSHARARRIVVNLRQISEYALTEGKTLITSDDAKKIEFYTGEAPTPRMVV